MNNLKNERVHGRHHRTRAEAETDLFDHIEPFYNRRQRHSTLGYACKSSSWKTGSVISMSRNWRHNSTGLKDEKQKEAQWRGVFEVQLPGPAVEALAPSGLGRVAQPVS